MIPSAAYGYGSEKSKSASPHRSIPKHKKERFDEMKSQKTIIKANVAFIIAVLLNENPQATPADAFEGGETDMEKLKKKSNRFAGYCYYFNFSCSCNDFHSQ